MHEAAAPMYMSHTAARKMRKQHVASMCSFIHTQSSTMPSDASGAVDIIYSDASDVGGSPPWLASLDIAVASVEVVETVVAVEVTDALSASIIAHSDAS